MVDNSNLVLLCLHLPQFLIVYIWLVKTLLMAVGKRMRKKSGHTIEKSWLLEMKWFATLGSGRIVTPSAKYGNIILWDLNYLMLFGIG